MRQKYTGDLRARKVAALRQHKKRHPEKWRKWRRQDYLKHKSHYIEYERRARLRKNFGLTVEQYDAMFQERHGLCDICHRPETVLNPRGEIRKLAVDHNHASGAIRGLLCSRCNQAIGLMSDSPDRLLSAASYLEKFNGTS